MAFFARVTESLQYWIMYLASWYRDFPASVSCQAPVGADKKLQIQAFLQQINLLDNRRRGDIQLFRRFIKAARIQQRIKMFPAGGYTWLSPFLSSGDSKDGFFLAWGFYRTAERGLSRFSHPAFALSAWTLSDHNRFLCHFPFTV